MWKVVFIVIILFLIFLLLLSKLTIALSIKGNAHEVIVDLHAFFIFRRIGIRKQFIFPNDTSQPEVCDKKEEAKEEREKERKADVSIQMIVSVIQYVIKQLHIFEITDFRWQTHIGTEEAASTGTIAGSLWAVKYWIAGLLFHSFTPKTVPIIRVTPHFQISILQTRLECMFRFRIGKAIKVIVGVIFFARKMQRMNQIKIKNVGKLV